MVHGRTRPENIFNKYNVLRRIKELTPPTPTDPEHQAEWWNEVFGTRVKNDVQMMLDALAESINNMVEL